MYLFGRLLHPRMLPVLCCDEAGGQHTTVSNWVRELDQDENSSALQQVRSYPFVQLVLLSGLTEICLICFSHLSAWSLVLPDCC